MNKIDRRAMIAASGAALLFSRTPFAHAAPAADGSEPFSWAMLVARAQRLARQPFVSTPFFPGSERIDYDDFNAARFRDERTIWNEMGDDTGIRLFPLSKYVQQPVQIALVNGSRATPLRFDPDLFDAPADSPVRKLGPDAGFGGFRIMNRARDGDWLSFLGATYFRAPAQRQFGLSARGIAVNTSIAGKEEFPRFTHFWLERTGESSVTVHALMDGESITGAFRFASRLTPQGVVQDVDAQLFPRRDIAELGLMAMTSMFWYDQADRAKRTDWRPEIHDSDMLSFASADGTVHCRPLVNPSAPRVDVFAERDPRGFGLLQRDRDFDHYQDDGVFYERRPSLWATSRQPMGAGEVRLYAFPTDSEYTDNIAAYWTPATPARAGRRITARYQLDWTEARSPASPSIATVENIWTGKSSQPDQPGVDQFLVDFVGVPSGVTPDIWVDLTGGTLVKKAGYPVLHQKDMFRMVLDIRRDGDRPTDIRAQLKVGNRPFSEYVHYPLGA